MESESNIHDERWCIICPEWEKFPQKLVIIDGWNIWKAQEILLEVTSNIRPKTHSCFHFISISRKAWIKCLEDFFTIVSRVRGDKNKLRFDFSRDYYCLNVMSSFRSWIVALCSILIKWKDLCHHCIAWEIYGCSMFAHFYKIIWNWQLKWLKFKLSV